MEWSAYLTFWLREWVFIWRLANSSLDGNTVFQEIKLSTKTPFLFMDDAKFTMTFVVTIMYLFYEKTIKEQAYISNTTKISFEICISSFMLQKLYNK